jgi:large subunit ribosomal protein L4
MSKIEIRSLEGKKARNVDVDDVLFEVTPNIHVMHEVVRAQQAARRQGTHETKTRGLVSGGGRKPWRQKGTGHARQGSTRSPQWKGGGTVFGPHPRSYAFRVNNKEVKLAMRGALSAKKADGQLVVVEDFAFEKPSTKQAVAYLKGLGLEGRLTLVIGNDDVNSYLSFRNIPKVCIIGACESNTYDFINNKALVITESALKYIEEVLS